MLVDSLTTTTKHHLFKTLNQKYDEKKKTNKTSHYLTLSKSCQICKLIPTKTNLLGFVLDNMVSLHIYIQG